MADREQIAATLAASLLKPIDYATGAARPLPDIHRAAAQQAVTVYHAVLAELARQQHEGD